MKWKNTRSSRKTLGANICEHITKTEVRRQRKPSTEWIDVEPDRTQTEKLFHFYNRFTCRDEHGFGLGCKSGGFAVFWWIWIRDEHGSGLDQNWSQFLPDQDWIGLTKFLFFNVIILEKSIILVVIQFHRFVKRKRIFCHQMQKICCDYFAIRTVSTIVHI